MDALKDKVIWITGASSGIGEALVYAFAERGAVLVLSARNEDELKRVKHNCGEKVVAEIVTMDISKTEELSEKTQQVLQKMETIDVMVHCAGVSQRSFAKDTGIDVYKKILEIGYFGTVQLTLAVLPHFLQNNKGQFVVISSIAGKTGLPLRTAYSSAKHALEGFFGSLRTELWKTAIQILVVRPGAVKTNIARNALTGNGTSFNKADKMIDNGLSAKECAETIVEAILQNKKEIVVGSFKEKLLLVINRFWPGLAFDFVKKLNVIEN